MKALLQTLPVLLALCAGLAQAQLYKWVGPDGKITYSDTPPPPAAARVETRPVPSAASAASDLPYEVAQAARNHPVTLYTTSSCSPCDDARRFLTERGIPFREKTVTSNEDVLQLRKIGADTNLPVLTVGRTRERGFETNAWNNALNIAGYPATNRLPRSYRNPDPEPAAPRPEAAQASKEEPVASEPPAAPTELPPATGNAPPGFRF